MGYIRALGCSSIELLHHINKPSSLTLTYKTINRLSKSSIHHKFSIQQQKCPTPSSSATSPPPPPLTPKNHLDPDTHRPPAAQPLLAHHHHLSPATRLPVKAARLARGAVCSGSGRWGGSCSVVYEWLSSVWKFNMEQYRVWFR